MKSLIDSLAKSEILTVVTELQVEMGVSLPQAQGELQDIFAMMPLALFIKDAESRIVLMNPACEALWGVSFAEMRGNRGERFLPAEQIEGFGARDRAAFASGKRIVNEELVWHHAHSENRWMETHKQPLFDQHGQPRLLIGMCVDISERKRAERALESSVQQLRALSEHEHTTKDRERRRIALGIHDDLAQNLLALRLDLSVLHARTGRCQPLLHQRTTQALATLDASIHAVRDLINELHPPTLELGLSAAIEWLLRQLELRNGMRCVLQLLDDSAVLDQRQTSAIFHVVEAALGYLGGHSGARALQVTLSLKPERLSIILSGDGQPAPDGGCGALNLGVMRERLADFGGELAVAPLPGTGTVLHMTLPGAGQAPV
ncbi:PAS domain-containing protein [Duganella sp. CT11-25]|uniref:PAS domain-containing sensor histidine kinase n=1 Tax=unclassified Duganella TaxID=2636909 RepID=UPI0039B0CFCF